MAQCGLSSKHKPKPKYSVNNNFTCSPSQLSATKPHRQLSTTIFSFSPTNPTDRFPHHNTISHSQPNARLNKTDPNISYKYPYNTKSSHKNNYHKSASSPSRTQIQKSKTYQLNCTHIHQSDQTNPQLTFKPVIHQMPHSIYSTHESEKIKVSRESTREKLIQDMTNKIRDRIQSKIKQQEQLQKKQCTFHPHITPFMSNNPQQQKILIFDKLFKQAQQIQQSKLQAEQKKKQKEQQQIQQLLNWKLNNPSINNTKILNSQKHNLAPIHTRIEQLIQNKIKNRRELYNKYQAQMKDMYKFQPNICSNSQKLTENRARKINKSQDYNKYKTDVVQRLYNQYKITKLNKEQLQRAAREQEQLFCTFHSNINNGVNQSRNRQQLYSDRQHNRGNNYETSRMCRNQQSSYNFVPKIDKLSSLIVMHTRGQQSQQQQLHRLSVQPIIDKSHNITLLNNKLSQSLTFTPYINPISSSPQIHPRPHSHLCPIPIVIQPSFQPQINPRSKLIRPRSAVQHSNRINKIKQEQLKYQMQQEYQIMKQCSFKPKINSKRHQSIKIKGVCDIQGIEKFMFWRDKARNLQQLQQLRQQKVFHPQHKYDQRMQHKNQ